MSDSIRFNVIGHRDRLVDRVAEEIQQQIVNNALPAGVKLPSEQELAERIGVSRTVIREAVHILTTKGLLETRHGVGTIVRQANGDQLSENLNLLLQTKGYDLDHLHQVRSILEVEIAGLAALQAHLEEIEELARIVERMETVAESDPLAYADLDAEFHRCLAKSSHNPLLVILLDSIADILREVRRSVSKFPTISLKGLPHHRQILELVEARDIAGARRVMKLHLDQAREIQAAITQLNE